MWKHKFLFRQAGTFLKFSVANCFRPRSNAFPKSAAHVRWRGAPSLILTQIARDKEAGAHQKREIQSRGQCFRTWAACTLEKRRTLKKLSSYWSAGQCEEVRTQQAVHVRVPEITVMNFSGITERSDCLNVYIVLYAERRLCSVSNLILTW